MSEETSEWLNQNVLVGYTDKRGTAWHYRASDQGDEPNHYPGPIPVEDVRRRLFHWDVLEGSLVARFDDGSEATDPSRKVLARSDTGDVLGIFKQSYTVHPYSEWLIDNVETILDEGLAIGSAGLLRKGAVGWVQIEMEDTLKSCDVEFRPFLTAATSLDGSLATTYMTGAQVVVCDNTLQAARSSADHVTKIRHSVKSLNRVADVREALDLVITLGDAYVAEIEQLNKRKVSQKLWESFVAAYTKPAEKPGKEPSKLALTMSAKAADQLHDLWNNDERVTPWKGTEYGVLAAVNTHQHHNVITLGRSKAERNAEFTVTGRWAKNDAQTLELLGSLR
jgi:phage/plasmid-like protein (TIGR03299 family)